MKRKRVKIISVDLHDVWKDQNVERPWPQAEGVYSSSSYR